MSLYPLLIDLLRSACSSKGKVWKDILQDAFTKVRQESMRTHVISTIPVKASQAKEAMQTAPQAVVPPLPKLQLAKLSSLTLSSKLKTCQSLRPLLSWSLLDRPFDLRSFRPALLIVFTNPRRTTHPCGGFSLMALLVKAPTIIEGSMFRHKSRWD